MTVKLKYFAMLRDQRGTSEETYETTAVTPGELYAELVARFEFKLPASMVRAAVNGAFVDGASRLNDGDEVVFIPPVAGG